jgi:hypothetical protein
VVRLILVVIGLLALAAIAVSRSGGFDPGPDASVEILTTGPTVVRLDFSPSASEIADGIRTELANAAAATRSEALAGEMTSLASDDDYVEELAASAAADFSTRAAAMAIGNYSVVGEGDRVTIIAINIELLPSGARDGINRDHEAGHSIINDAIAVRCGEVIARDRITKGTTGEGLVSSIRAGLFALGDIAHEKYHQAVAAETFGSHAPAAGRVVDELVDAGCAT